MAGEIWDGVRERRRTERRKPPTALVPAAFLVQLAASHAGIGPFARRDRETPAAATSLYRKAAGAPLRTPRIAARLA